MFLFSSMVEKGIISRITLLFSQVIITILVWRVILSHAISPSHELAPTVYCYGAQFALHFISKGSDVVIKDPPKNGTGLTGLGQDHSRLEGVL